MPVKKYRILTYRYFNDKITIVSMNGEKPMKNIKTDSIKNFYKALLSLENEEECSLFFDDICTIKELQDIAQRLEVAKMLKDGKNYQTISAQIGASTATISRVNRCLLYGNGGYETILARIEEND